MSPRPRDTRSHAATELPSCQLSRRTRDPSTLLPKGSMGGQIILALAGTAMSSPHTSFVCTTHLGNWLLSKARSGLMPGDWQCAMAAAINGDHRVSMLAHGPERRPNFLRED